MTPWMGRSDINAQRCKAKRKIQQRWKDNILIESTATIANSKSFRGRFSGLKNAINYQMRIRVFLFASQSPQCIFYNRKDLELFADVSSNESLETDVKKARL